MSDKPYEISDSELEKFVSKYHIEISKNQIDSLLEMGHKNIINKWTKALLRNATIIPKDSIDAVFNDNKKGWMYFYKHFGYSFYEISIPLFIWNYTCCIFITESHCGWECGDRKINDYLKIKGKWKKILTYTE